MTASSWFINMKDRHLCIPVQSSSVYFLHTPEQFYETLLQRIGSAKQRVVLSALYLGSDALEQRLVDCLAQAAASAAAPPTATPDQEAAGLLAQHDGNSSSGSDGRQQRMLSVSILLDFFRATRGATTAGTSSTTMLAPLTANENVEVRLFHTPKLRGLLKSVLSERVNEVVGLQHMKFFVFDDTVLITGANLSDQYFVNRQDRYLLIEHCPVLADFFVDLFHVVGAHSFRLRPDGHVDEFPGGPTSPVHPETGSLPHIQRQMNDAVCKLFTKFKARVAATAAGCSPSSTCAVLDDSKQYNNNKEEADGTFVVPFLQMGLFNVNQEVELFSKLFSQDDDDGGGGGSNMALTLMTAYFNLSDTYADLILRKCRFPVNIVFASPKANGFLGADGLSGHIPSLYEHCALAFVRRTLQANQADRLAFAEWVRPGWTFHAKGLWVEERQQQQQGSADGAATASHCRGHHIATVVGSSNFGFRSAQRDLEAQLLLVTDNEALKGRIAEEKNSLLAHAEVLDPSTFLRRDCLIPAWLKYCARLFRNFF